MNRSCLLFLLIILFGCENYRDSDLLYFSSFDNSRIAFSDEGAGPAVLLIHGFISDGNSWRQSYLKEDLLKAGFRVVIPDLRGNGHSMKSEKPEAYADDAEVKDLLALVRHLHLSFYSAIGYSRGSIVLAKLLTRDTTITRAVMGGMGLDFSDPNWARRKIFCEAFQHPNEAAPETRGALDYAESIGANFTILSLLQQFQPVTTPRELKAIQTDVLVLAGDQDHENGDPQRLASILPNSQLSIIQGTHNEVYKTTAFSSEVIHFLKE